MDFNLLQRVQTYFLPGQCFEEVVVRLNVLDEKCAPILAGRVLGVLATSAAAFSFAPQIHKIHTAKSGAGISLSSQILALVAAASITAYNYERGFVIGQWGDVLFITLQLLIIVVQILWYADAKSSAFSFVALCVGAGTAVALHCVPMYALRTAQAVTLPIVFASKSIQIVSSYRKGGTGQLSLLSTSIQSVRVTVRVFTSVQEAGGEFLVIAPYALGSVLNTIVLLQILYYSSGEKQRNSRVDSEESKAKALSSFKAKKTN